jgi:hypothetical protein
VLQRQNERLAHHKNLVARITSTNAAAWAAYKDMVNRAPSLSLLGLPEITNERRLEINKSWAAIRKELLPLTDDGSNEKEHIHKFMRALINMVIESAGLRSTLRSHPEPTLIGLNSSARIPDACLTEANIEKSLFETTLVLFEFKSTVVPTTDGQGQTVTYFTDLLLTITNNATDDNDDDVKSLIKSLGLNHRFAVFSNRKFI